jgi:hypothetical protein
MARPGRGAKPQRQICLRNSKSTKKWVNIQLNISPPMLAYHWQKRGETILSLCHQPQNGQFFAHNPHSPHE